MKNTCVQTAEQMLSINRNTRDPITPANSFIFIFFIYLYIYLFCTYRADFRAGRLDMPTCRLPHDDYYSDTMYMCSYLDICCILCVYTAHTHGQCCMPICSATFDRTHFHGECKHLAQFHSAATANTDMIHCHLSSTFAVWL